MRLSTPLQTTIILFPSSHLGSYYLSPFSLTPYIPSSSSMLYLFLLSHTVFLLNFHLLSFKISSANLALLPALIPFEGSLKLYYSLFYLPPPPPSSPSLPFPFFFLSFPSCHPLPRLSCSPQLPNDLVHISIMLCSLLFLFSVYLSSTFP